MYDTLQGQLGDAEDELRGIGMHLLADSVRTARLKLRAAEDSPSGVRLTEEAQQLPLPAIFGTWGGETGRTQCTFSNASNQSRSE